MKRVPAYAFTKEEVQILKAAWTETHARLALNLIIDRICGVMGSSFVPGDPHATAFLEGVRWPAQQIAIAINTPLDKLIQEPPNESPGTPVLTATERAARGAANYARAKR
jgi:hypothetical protein